MHITGRRPNGYHELQTVFQFLDLADHLQFTPRPPGVFELQAPASLAGPDNLCLQAARALHSVCGRDFGVHIDLRKRIPVGGGLGGGSSDAATTLVALNQLFALGLSESELARLGLSLGADVPVFVRGVAAWAEGIGEFLTPVQPDTPWALVLDPGVTVNTRMMFAADGLTRDCPPETIRASGYEQLCNVFEPVVRRIYPDIDRALVWLESRAELARLSGSGGCVFGLFAEHDAAVQAERQCSEVWNCWLTQLRNVSPLVTLSPFAERGSVA